jgi:hypothetical protein
MPTVRNRYVPAVVLGLLVALGTTQARAEFQLFNSLTPADNASTRASWLAAAGIATPQYLVDFEAGFANNQNISGVAGLLPGGLVISDTSDAHAAIIRTGATAIGGSSPVGAFAVTQNEAPYLVLDFSASPVDYVAAFDIDQAGTVGIVTFVGGATANFTLETTGNGANTAEFFGLFRNDRPQITRVQFDASGDGLWGLDNIQYGPAAVPEPASLAMLGSGALGLLAYRGWRRRADRS